MVYVKEQAHLVNTPQHPILLYYRSLSLGEASILSGSPSTPPRKALEAEKRSLCSKYVRKEHLLAHHLQRAQEGNLGLDRSHLVLDATARTRSATWHATINSIIKQL